MEPDAEADIDEMAAAAAALGYGREDLLQQQCFLAELNEVKISQVDTGLQQVRPINTKPKIQELIR